VKKVEPLIRLSKPSAVEASHPVMCERKDQKPHQQYSVVDYCAPQKKAAREFNVHLLHSSFGILREEISRQPLKSSPKPKCGEQKMRSNSQLLPSTNSLVDKTGSMKTPIMLLLTNDNELEELVADALSEIGGISHLTRDAGDALETICGVNDLDLAVIDFEHGPYGMTLLSAISTLREDLPVVVITRDDEKHVEALAYANGATACFSKQAVATQLANAIRELSKPRPQPVFV
jgi:CheY-like chemotaxis protein